MGLQSTSDCVLSEGKWFLRRDRCVALPNGLEDHSRRVGDRCALGEPGPTRPKRAGGASRERIAEARDEWLMK